LKHLNVEPGRGSITGRVLLEGKSTQIADVTADPDYELHDAQRLAGYRTHLGVPLSRNGRIVGMIILSRKKVSPFNGKEIELVETFADQAVIAINNAQLFEEVQARTRELTRSVAELKALGQVSQAVNSSLDLTTVLNTILGHACELSDTGGGAIYVLDEASDELLLEAGHNMTEEHLAAVREHPIRRGEPVVGECTDRGEPVQIADVTADTRSYPLFGILERAGFRALLAVPLLHQGRPIGALLVRRRQPGAFPPEVVDLLQSFASQSSLAIYNARLFREIEQKSEQLAVASQHKSQFLANMSHELRTPLNAIIGYSEMLQEEAEEIGEEAFIPDLQKVNAAGKHLLGLINDVLDLAKIEAGGFDLRESEIDLPRLIEESMSMVAPRARSGACTLRAELADNLPLLFADERAIKQVLLNLLSNAVKFTQAGGSVTPFARLEEDGALSLGVVDPTRV
jgi:GAF domain-containing protein